MGTYASNIRVRDSLANSVACLAETFNGFTDALAGCGMLPVDAATMPGQAGRFVTGAAGAGETSLSSLNATASSKLVCGFNGFKHPTREIYLKVDYLDIAFTAASRAGFVEFSVGTGLAGGALGNSSGAVSCLTVGNGAPTIATITANPAPIFSACGEDFFWLYVKPDNVGLMLATNVYPSLPHKNLFGGGVGVFGAEGDPARLCLMSGLEVTSASGSNPYYGVAPFSNASDVFASRYWTFDGALWQARRNGSLGGLFDPATTSTDGGVRVGRAAAVVGGVLSYFDFGFVNTAVLADLDLASVDLTGAGTLRQYRACFGLGPSTPSFYGATAAHLAGPILPWPQGG